MGLEVIPIAALVALLLLSPSKPANANYIGTYKDGSGVEVEYLAGDEINDYQTIYMFVTQNYQAISAYDADIIAKSLVSSGKTHNIDPKFAAALIARESGFNKEAISSTGAKGLGQIKEFNYPKLEITDPFSIEQNTYGTTKYLKILLGEWKSDSGKVGLALASYLKGPNAVRKEFGNYDIKTRAYVNDILTIYEKLCANNKNF